MKVHELKIKAMHSPDDVVRFLKEKELQQGDVLKVLIDQGNGDLVLKTILYIIMVALSSVIEKNSRNKRKAEDEKMLDNLLKGKSADEIEKQIKDDYGVKVEVEQREDEEERDAWHQLSMKGLERAYSYDEPEYTEEDIKEPNPNYKGWKKEL